MTELAAVGTALRDAPLDGFDEDPGEVLDAAAAEMVALLARAERVALALSDELQRRFFTHAGTPAPVGIRPRSES